MGLEVERKAIDSAPVEPEASSGSSFGKLWTLFFILFVLWSSREAILGAYGELLVVDEATTGADAVLVLAGDPLVRIPRALELIGEGYADRLLVTTPKLKSGRLAHLQVTELQSARAVMQELGQEVPVAAIPSRDGETTSTLDEAWDLLVFAEQEGLGHVIAVTEACSTRRARIAMARAFRDSEVVVEVAAARNEIFDATNWWRSDKGIACYVLEPIKTVAYLLEMADPDWMRND